jgi:hypothetical protein
MKKEADRIRSWRERKKAEGMTSYTVHLSREARVILTEEKEKNGDSYAIIIEKALQALKKQDCKPPVLKRFSKLEELPVRVSTIDNQPPAIPLVHHENGGQPRILVDDLANYPNVEGIEQKQAMKERNDIYDLKFNEGIITRLLRFSEDPFRRRKKWFK